MAARNRLLVEDNDDMHAVGNICKVHGLPPTLFEVKLKSGVENILNTLDVEILASSLENLGIVVDADSDLAARWEAIRHRLIGLGYRPPPAPDPLGTVLEQVGSPRIGVWVMPDNTIPGMLEDFVRLLVPDSDALWDIAGNCLDEIPAEGRPFSKEHRIKAQVHTWLAWQKKPGLPIGLAITFRYLDANSVSALRLLAWVRRLFPST